MEPQNMAVLQERNKPGRLKLPKRLNIADKRIDHTGN